MTLKHAFGDAGALGELGEREGRERRLRCGLQDHGAAEAIAGPAFRVIIASGKFHGVMQATTPIGSLVTTMRLSA